MAVNHSESVDSKTSRILSAIKSTVILVCLLAIGYAGHSTHWTFGFGPHVEEAGQEHGASADRAIPADIRTKQVKGGLIETKIDSLAPNVLKFDSPETVVRSGIELVPIKVRSIGEVVRANGMVDFDQHHLSRISGIVSGKVWRIERRLGDTVKKGDVLALIESVQVGEAKARFLSALAIRQSREETLRILDSLTNIIAQRQLREAKLSAQEARIELLNATQTLANLGVKAEIDEFAAMGDVERVSRLRFLGLPDYIVKEINKTESTSNLIPLTAPFDGLVIGRDVGLGEVVEPAKPLFEIADVSRMWIVLNVRKEDVYKLQPGQKIVFLGDGFRTPLASSINWIASEVDEVKLTLQVRGEVNNILKTGDRSDSPFVNLKARTFGTGIIEVGGKTEAIIVPKECVHRDGDKSYVFRKIDDRTFEGVDVKTGLEDENGIEILNGLPKEALLAGRGSHILKSQMLLKKIETGVSD